MIRKLLIASLVLLLAAPAFADREEEEEEKGPDEQGIGVPEEGQERENPLKEILELMRQAEQKLLEAHAGTGTQGFEREAIEKLDEKMDEKLDGAKSASAEARRKLEEAMEGQERAIDTLQKLIQQAENQQSQSGGGGGQQAKPQSGKKKSSASQRRQQRQQMRNARLNPQQQEESQQQERNDQQSRNDQRQMEPRSPDDPNVPEPDEVSPDGRRWGVLPPTAEEAVESAKKTKVPAAYGDEWEQFLRELAEEEE